MVAKILKEKKRLNYKGFIKIISIICLFLLSIFLCLYNLDKNPVQQWDEQTNIAVVNETLSSKNFTGDLIYQNQPFFEKPPVWYFATIGTVKVSGENNTSYRLLSTISGVGIVSIVYFIVKKQWGHWAGIISGLSILSVGHLFINNVSGYFSTHTFRSADLDALQILFIMLGILSYVTSKTAKSLNEINRNRILIFLFSGLAVMTKGPVGLLPIIILLFSHPSLKSNLSFLRSENPTNSAKGSWFNAPALNLNVTFKKIWLIIKTHHLIPFSIFLLTILPWHIWMYVKFGDDFLQKYFFYHMVERATATIEEHKEQIWFYLQMFLEPKVFIVGVPVIAGIIIAIKNKIWKTDIVVKTAILGILIPLIFFTLVPTKLAWYNLYIYPFAAIMVGYLFNEKFENKYLNIAKNVSIICLITIGIIQNMIWIAKL